VLTVTPTLAPEADRNLPITIIAVDLPAGQSEFQMIYQTLPINQTGRRPYVSDNAAIRRGAVATPRKKMEKTICPVVGSTLRSYVMSSNAGAIMEADMCVMREVVEQIIPMQTFFWEGHSYGFDLPLSSSCVCQAISNHFARLHGLFVLA
jgi:hypothetical protein